MSKQSNICAGKETVMPHSIGNLGGCGMRDQKHVVSSVKADSSVAVAGRSDMNRDCDKFIDSYLYKPNVLSKNRKCSDNQLGTCDFKLEQDDHMINMTKTSEHNDYIHHTGGIKAENDCMTIPISSGGQFKGNNECDETDSASKTQLSHGKVYSPDNVSINNRGVAGNNGSKHIEDKNSVGQITHHAIEQQKVETSIDAQLDPYA